MPFRASDGYALRGTLVSGPAPRVALLVSGGTGFVQRFYRPFAEHAARRGAAVLLYDYRGIGGSAPPGDAPLGTRLASSGIDYVDWGRLDMPAALAALRKAAPALPIVHLGHSAGGHMLGFMPDPAPIVRHAFVAVGSGYWRRHPVRYNLVELYFWNVLGPFQLARHGYIPRGLGWRGAPLPPDVFRTWRRWCRSPDYYGTELRGPLRPHSFEAINAPIRSWVYADDPIANACSAPDILACYPSAPSALVLQHPEDNGFDRIGHEGMFRPGHETLWDEWLDWLIPNWRP